MVYVSTDLLENKITRACHLIHAQMLAAAALGERISSEVSSCGAALYKRWYLANFCHLLKLNSALISCLPSNLGLLPFLNNKKNVTTCRRLKARGALCVPRWLGGAQRLHCNEFFFFFFTSRINRNMENSRASGDL